MIWPIAKLGDFSLQMGGSLNPDKFPDEVFELFSIPSYDSGNPEIVQGSEIGSSKKLVQPGDILLSKIVPHIKRVWIVTKEEGKRQIASGEWIVYRTKKIDPDYLRFFLFSDSFRQRFMGTVKGVGGSLLRATPSLVDELEIPLPPLETQKQIAAVLEKADQLRKDCQKMERELNSLAQSVFVDMFGDPVTNPKGWKVKPLVSLLKQPLQNGAYYPKEEYSDDGVEMVHMGDVFYDFIPRGGMKRVSASKRDIEKYKLTSNDILISRRSLMLEGAAKPSLIQESNEDLIFESSMIRLTPDTEIINVMYLFYYLSNPTVKQHYIYQYITGATIKGINQTNLEKVEVLVPDLTVQNDFLVVEKKIRNQKLELAKLVVEYEENFNSLMQLAFKGDLNLKAVA